MKSSRETHSHGPTEPLSPFCIRDVEGAEALRDDWAELFEESSPRHPFLHGDWYLNWWQAFSQPEWDMRLWGVRERDKLLAVAPLYVRVERRWGRRVRVLRFWADPHSNRTGPLCAPDGSQPILDTLSRAIVDSGSWDLAIFEYLDLADTVIQGFIDGFAGLGCRVGISANYVSPKLHLPKAPEDVEARIGSSFRQSLRRKLKAAEKEGVGVAWMEGADGMAPAFQVSRETWQHEAGTGLDSTPALARFSSGLFERPWLKERVRVALLELKGTPVAFELNLRMNRTLYNLKVGYDGEKASLSPGIVLRHETIKAAVLDGFDVFDFLGETEPYKNHWANDVTPHSTATVFRPTVGGALLHFALFRAKPFLGGVPGVRRLARALRAFGRGGG